MIGSRSALWTAGLFAFLRDEADFDFTLEGSSDSTLELERLLKGFLVTAVLFVVVGAAVVGLVGAFVRVDLVAV